MIVKMAEKYNECSGSFAHYDQKTESEEAKLRLAIVDEQDKKLKQFQITQDVIKNLRSDVFKGQSDLA